MRLNPAVPAVDVAIWTASGREGLHLAPALTPAAEVIIEVHLEGAEVA